MTDKEKIAELENQLAELQARVEGLTEEKIITILGHCYETYGVEPKVEYSFNQEMGAKEIRKALTGEGKE